MTVRAPWLPECRRVCGNRGRALLPAPPAVAAVHATVCRRATQTTGTYRFGSELEDVLQAQACPAPGIRSGCLKLGEETSRDAVRATLSTNE